MKRLIILFLLLLGGSLPSFGQQKQALSAAATTCTVTGTSCLLVGVDSTQGGASFVISANASGNTIQFEASGDGANSWVALNVTPSNSTTAVTSATGTGTWKANVAGYTNVRMRMSTLVGGTTTVTITLSTASATRISQSGSVFTGYSIGNTANASNGAGGSTVATSAITITAGQALVGFIFGCTNGACNFNTTYTLTISDNQSDSWVCPAAATVLLTGLGRATQVCYVCSAVGGSTTFTGSMTSSVPFYLNIGIAAVNGIASSNCGDTTSINTANTTGANPVVTSSTLAQSSEFVVGVEDGASGNATPVQTNIIGTNPSMQYIVGPASGNTQALSWTSTSQAYGAIAIGLNHS